MSEAHAELTRSYIQKLIEEGQVTVNGEASRANYKVKPEDHVVLTVPPPRPLDVLPEAIPLEIIHEDAQLLVINKPAGMVVHPAPGHATGTLVNALLHHCKDLSGIGGVERPGIVHRLDKDTSGLIVVAKTEKALASLLKQFKDRSINKVYLALARGRLEPAKGLINQPIGRHKVHRKKMAGVEGGREAQTRYEVVTHYEGFDLVRLFPKTGRTHQIRVHLAGLGHPILADPLYGGKSGKTHISRQALHAHRLEFQHPVSGNTLAFEAPLPEDMQVCISSGKQHPA